MSTVAEFPSARVRQWAAIERLLLRVIRKAGLADEVASRIAGNVRPLFDVLYTPSGVDLVFSEPCATEFEAQQQRLLDLIESRNQAILLERIRREIDVYATGV